MSDLKTILDTVPEHHRGFLLVYAPTALCFILVGFFLWMAYQYAEAYQVQHAQLSVGQAEFIQTLTIHNNTLLENQRLMLEFSNIAWAICMNQAYNKETTDRCKEAQIPTRRPP